MEPVLRVGCDMFGDPGSSYPSVVIFRSDKISTEFSSTLINAYSMAYGLGRAYSGELCGDQCL